MSEARSFINPQAQSYESLKADTPMSANQRAKFDVLNAHIANGVVVGGELVIVGDSSTPSCTSHEAFLMAKAFEVHHQLEVSGAGVDDFFLDNYEMLQTLVGHVSTGVGVATDGWSKHLESIKKTLVEIDELHRAYLGDSSLRARDEFYAKRAALFHALEGKLDKMAAFGSGLRNTGSIKRMLEISTKSFLHTGEIAKYADKVTGVSSAANLIKKGTYLGTALEVASTGLAIHKACTLGREEDCRKARYVETSALAGRISGSAGGGVVGGALLSSLCVAVGIPSAGFGGVTCVVIGAAVGGKYGGDYGGEWMGSLGELIYESVRE
ncbi:hypothetical protein ACLEJW_16985 [Pseudomonas sp. SMSB3]|uniref:hypothetical protein n=1 Tax=unclassified Pseudomonas TaxID=196821 RepID=UPI00119DD6FD|nr:hypothetical protein [Pseudomonas sp. URMO17WK12:I11]